jgi:hypothetical protein
MSGIQRPIVAGIVVIYLLCLGAQFFGPYPDLPLSKAFGVAVLGFLLVAVGLHVAAVAVFRSRKAILLSVASIAGLAVFVLAALMKITGDSL